MQRATQILRNSTTSNSVVTMHNDVNIAIFRRGASLRTLSGAALRRELALQLYIMSTAASRLLLTASAGREGPADGWFIC